MALGSTDTGGLLERPRGIFETPHVAAGKRGAGGRLWRWFARVTAVVAVLWVATSVAELRRVRVAQHWPTVPGTIAHAGLVDVDMGYAAGRKRRMRTLFAATYSYQVGDRIFSSTRLHPVLRASERDARADLVRYRQGTAVTVHYAPANPTDAALETHMPPRRVLEIALGLLLATGLLLLGLRPQVLPRKAPTAESDQLAESVPPVVIVKPRARSAT